MNQGSSPTDTPIGLVGLGLIGSALVARLRQHGFAVLGYDVSAARHAEVAALGGEIAASAGDVFRRCSRVLFSLPSHREVAAVMAEVGATLRAGHVIVDTTTGEPVATATLAQGLERRGIGYLDATLSGNSAQLRAGVVTVMVGGAPADVAAVKDLLAVMGSRVFHTGPAGTGARMKLVTNLVLGLNRAALAEGLVLARALGLDAALALSVLKDSAASSRVMDAKGAKMLHNEFSPDARLAQHLKDVRLIIDAGEQAGLPMPLSRAHRAVLVAAEAMGWGESDNSALIKALEPGKIVRLES